MLLSFNTEIFNGFKLFSQLVKLLTIKVEELISNLFNTERLFQVIQSRMFWIYDVICDKALKPAYRCMARLILPDQIRIAFGRSKVFRCLQAAILNLHLIIKTN